MEKVKWQKLYSSVFKYYLSFTRIGITASKKLGNATKETLLKES